MVMHGMLSKARVAESLVIYSTIPSEWFSWIWPMRGIGYRMWFLVRVTVVPGYSAAVTPTLVTKRHSQEALPFVSVKKATHWFHRRGVPLCTQSDLGLGAIVNADH